MFNDSLVLNRKLQAGKWLCYEPNKVVCDVYLSYVPVYVHGTFKTYSTYDHSKVSIVDFK